MPNKLKHERSPYLRSAAHQPVNWLPWGDEAFERAKSEDKPILLDIGAVWCHWCHVMDHESYENPEVAKIVNDFFIPVKVDRDERPDIDARYQTAVGAISGQGGWPLTALLTPEGKVFFGGTYFPPEDRYGRPGLKRVLEILAEKYRSDRAKILESAEEIYSHLKKAAERSSDSVELSEAIVDAALSSISSSFDIRHGGFGSAPKFPHPSVIDFLLWRYSFTGEKWMISIVESTLRAMARGGIYDQLAGGFHRYSTDERWIIPHFEKMLYDNAGLLKNYVHAYQATGDVFFKEIVHGIISFTNTVLSDQQNGGFYASQDADIGMEDDGDYFTWMPEEAQQVLSPEEFEVISMHFHLWGNGEMHSSNRHVLFVAVDAREIAHSLGKSEAEVQQLIKSGRKKLLAARLERKTPFVDPSIYSSWNGMMISAYIDAYKAFGEKSHLNFAIKSLERILKEGVSPSFDVAHTVSSSTGYLDDHVQMVAALLDAFEATAEEKYFNAADQIMQRTIERFWDGTAGGFLDLPSGTPSIGALELPHKPIQDVPTSSSNAVAISSLIRLYYLTEDETYRSYAEQALRYFAPICKGYGIFAAAYFHALDLFLNPPPYVVIVGRKDDPRTQRLHEAAIRTYRPNKMVVVYDPEAVDSTQLPSSVPKIVSRATEPTGYVCAGSVCAPPLGDERKLAETIHTFGVARRVRE